MGNLCGGSAKAPLQRAAAQLHGQAMQPVPRVLAGVQAERARRDSQPDVVKLGAWIDQTWRAIQADNLPAGPGSNAKGARNLGEVTGTVNALSKTLRSGDFQKLEVMCVSIITIMNKEKETRPDCYDPMAKEVYGRLATILVHLKAQDIPPFEIVVDQARAQPALGADERVAQLGRRPQQMQELSPAGRSPAARAHGARHAPAALGPCMARVKTAMDSLRAKLGANGARNLAIEKDVQKLERFVMLRAQSFPDAYPGSDDLGGIADQCLTIQWSIERAQLKKSLNASPGSYSNEVKALVLAVWDATGCPREAEADDAEMPHPFAPPAHADARGVARAHGGGHAPHALGPCLTEIDQMMTLLREALTADGGGAHDLGIQVEMEALEAKIALCKKGSPDTEKGSVEAKAINGACMRVIKAIEARQSPREQQDPGSKSNQVKGLLDLVRDATGFLPAVEERAAAVPHRAAAQPAQRGFGQAVPPSKFGHAAAVADFMPQGAVDSANMKGPVGIPPANVFVSTMRQHSKALDGLSPTANALGLPGLFTNSMASALRLSGSEKLGGPEARGVAAACDRASALIEEKLESRSGFQKNMLTDLLKAVAQMRDATGCPAARPAANFGFQANNGAVPLGEMDDSQQAGVPANKFVLTARETFARLGKAGVNKLGLSEPFKSLEDDINSLRGDERPGGEKAEAIAIQCDALIRRLEAKREGLPVSQSQFVDVTQEFLKRLHGQMGCGEA